MDRDYDEEGEPILDPDAQSDREPSEEKNWDQEFSANSPEDDDPKPKSRKRLIKKRTNDRVQDDNRAFDDGSEDDDGRAARNGIDSDLSDEELVPKKARKEKTDSREGKGKKKQKFAMADKLSLLARRGGGGSSSSSSNRIKKNSKEKSSRAVSFSHGGKQGDREMKEMWDSVAGIDSEEDNEGVRTKDDDAFIDDTGVDPDDRFGDSDNEAGFIGDAPQAEEGDDDDLKSLFKTAKSRNKKIERTAEETAMLVEQFMARLEVAAEEDAELNRQSKPAINKLKMLPSLINVLSKYLH